MKNVLIACEADPKNDPRPNRMINWLKESYDVTVITKSSAALDGVASFSAEMPARTSKLLKLAGILPPGLRGLLRKPARKILAFPAMLNQLIKIRTGRIDDLLWPIHELTRKMQEQMSGRTYDLIITHDCSLLPLVFGLKQSHTKVMLDAREFYPKNYNDQWKWRLQYRPINEYLCQKYLHRCDKIITVSDGLAQEYRKEFNVESEVLMSLPAFHDIQPAKPEDKKIKMIYHGWVGMSRRTEVMIDLMNYVDERFSLDFMVMLDKSDYAGKFLSKAKGHKNIRIIKPVAMRDIVPFTNTYDIGLFLCPPNNLNLTYALPNKLFEFIQARLMVAIGPGIEMRKIVDQYDCGIVSEDFEPQSLAHLLNRLSTEQLMYHKNQSHIAAQVLNERANRKKIRAMVQELIGE